MGGSESPVNIQTLLALNAIENTDLDALVILQALTDVDPPDAIRKIVGPSNVISIEDGLSSLPIEGLTIDISATQDGTGTPAPDNVRKINGWTGANITRTGKNVLGGTALANAVKAAIPAATIDENAKTVSFYASSEVTQSIFEGFKPSVQYTAIMRIEKTEGNDNPNLQWGYTDGTFGAFAIATGSSSAPVTIVRTSNQSRSLKSLRKRNQSGTTCLYYDQCGLFEGVVTAEDYETYNGIILTIDWSSSAGIVYGGSLNVLTGELTVNKIGQRFDGTETGWEEFFTGSSKMFRYTDSRKKAYSSDSAYRACSHFPNAVISSDTTDVGFYVYSYDTGSAVTFLQFRPNLNDISSLADWKTWLANQNTAGTPLTCWWQIQDPYTYYQLTPQDVSLFDGYNAIWSDAGNTTLTYKTKERG